MKICIIPRGWPTKDNPQLGIFEKDQAVALSKLGHEVFYLVLDLRSKFRFKKLGVHRDVREGVCVYTLYAGHQWYEIMMKISPRLQYKLAESLFFHLFKKVVKKEGRPDVVYGHYLRYCSRALSVKRSYDIPAVGIEHWSEMGFDPIKEHLKQKAATTYPYLDRQLVVSESLHDNILKQLGTETTVVYNIVGDAFSYEEHVKHDNVVRFVLTGNLIPIKRFDLVIKALAAISPLPENVQFLIIGKGEEKEKLTRMITDNKLSDAVFLTGQKSREYIRDRLREADVYILSSFSETFGVAPIEALRCGVPVIATDCGGSRSFMNDFNGIMVPVDDVKAMSEAILYMIEHYKDYDRKRIAEDCRQRFSSEAIGRQLESIFEDVIRKSKNNP